MTEHRRSAPTSRNYADSAQLHRYALCRDHVAGAVVLELGCRDGSGAALLAEAALSVTAVDVDPVKIAAAHRRHARDERLVFVEADVRALPMADGKFDVVVALGLLDRIPEADRVVDEIRRVLKSGGLAVVSMDVGDESTVAHAEDVSLALGRCFRHVETFAQRSAVASFMAPENVEAREPNHAAYRGFRPILRKGSRRPGIEAGVVALDHPQSLMMFCSDQPVDRPAELHSVFVANADEPRGGWSKPLLEIERLREIVAARERDARSAMAASDGLLAANRALQNMVARLDAELSRAAAIPAAHDSLGGQDGLTSEGLQTIASLTARLNGTPVSPDLPAIADALNQATLRLQASQAAISGLERDLEAQRRDRDDEGRRVRVEAARDMASRRAGQDSPDRGSQATLWKAAAFAVDQVELSARLEIQTKQAALLATKVKEAQEAARVSLEAQSALRAQAESNAVKAAMLALDSNVQRDLTRATLAVRRQLPPLAELPAIHAGRLSWADSRLLRELHLFDADWYAGQVGGLKPKQALAHFRGRGLRQGRDPHPFFNSRWFAARHPQIQNGLAPILAYLRHPDRAALSPHPLIDIEYYLDRYPDIRKSGMNPTLHFAYFGDSERRSPHVLIDFDWIESTWPRAQAEAFTLRRYLAEPALFRLSTHPLFDPDHYLGQNPDVETLGVNPLFHYLAQGWREGRSPNPGFENDWYLADNPGLVRSGQNPLVHYVLHGAADRRRPNPVFDPAYYLDQYPDVAQAGMDPLRHYLTIGWREGRRIAADIDNDLAMAGIADPSKPLALLAHLLGRDQQPRPPVPAMAVAPDEAWPPPARNGYWMPKRLHEYVAERFGRRQFDTCRYLFSVIELYKNDPEAFASSADMAILLKRARELSAARGAEEPAASIVIPVYNNILDTLTSIVSLLETAPSTPFEILVGDDCSTDSTAQTTGAIGGVVRHVRHARNLGFLHNCNETARLARGRVVVFLNNDTIMLPGWLDALMLCFERDPRIGYAGSKLINWDGSLQEAGGIFWADGSAWNFGRGQDPGLPEFNYLKDADYCSGASIAVPVDLWRELGGFDPIYAPAYCEDSDLAFRVRARGYRTVYQPASELVHHEGRSHGRDLASGTKAYQVANQQTLFERWKDTIAAENQPNPERLFVARDRSGGRPHILIVDHYVPQWDRDAGSRTMYHYIRLFVERGFQVTFWPDNLNYDETYARVLQGLGVEVLYGLAYLDRFEQWLRDNGRFIDYVLLSRPHVAIKYLGHVRAHSTARIIYYGHDLHFLRILAQNKLAPSDDLLASAATMKELELSICAAVDVFLFPSREEIEAVRAEAGADLVGENIPMNVFDSSEVERFDLARLAVRNRKTLLFVGGFNHAPNIDAVRWLVGDILPVVLAADPSFELLIVGSNPPLEFEALAGPRVRLLGRVSDEQLAELYAMAGAAVAPLRYGGGVKGKVIEALAKAVPIVATSFGVQGIPDAGGFIAVADDAEAFAKAILALANEDLTSLGRRVRRGIDFIIGTYSLEAASAKLQPFIPELGGACAAALGSEQAGNRAAE
ncbi:MAG: glycosyltransferase [Mesorhizobium sp.]|nr:glycosyltransferase [Mesorhizobium sp.]